MDCVGRMKSNKQRRAEIKARRAKRAAKAAGRKPSKGPREVPGGTAPCNRELLAPVNSYGAPDFVIRGYYQNIEFTCRDCAKQELWRATQQKWWYEVAKGDVWTTATRCNTCRRIERERKTEARRVHLEGVARRRARQRPA